MTRDEALIDLIKRANELGFKLVGVMDNYTENEGDNVLMVTNIKKKYGVNVSNGLLPLSVFVKLMDKS